MQFWVDTCVAIRWLCINDAKQVRNSRENLDIFQCSTKFLFHIVTGIKANKMCWMRSGVFSNIGISKGFVPWYNYKTSL